MVFKEAMNLKSESGIDWLSTHKSTSALGVPDTHEEGKGLFEDEENEFQSDEEAFSLNVDENRSLPEFIQVNETKDATDLFVKLPWYRSAKELRSKEGDSIEYRITFTMKEIE